MSLFKSAKKYEKESKRSVELKALLDAHLKTYPAARAAYENMRPEVIRLTAELNMILQGEGHTKNWEEKKAELRKARLVRDDSLHSFGTIKADFELELSQLTHFFIVEELERWIEEEKKISSEKVHQEVPKTPDEIGVFSIGKPHRILTNMKSVLLFREKSLQSRNQLRDMGCFSIPEIVLFIEKAKTELREIDLTASVVELDEISFRQETQDLRKESGRTASGVLTADSAIEIKPSAGEKGKSDELFARHDRLKGAFKPQI